MLQVSLQPTEHSRIFRDTPEIGGHAEYPLRIERALASNLVIAACFRYTTGGRGVVLFLEKEVTMFVHIILALLLLIVIFPMMCVTILGANPSSPKLMDAFVVRMIFLLGIASLPRWLVLAGMNVSGLWIVWGAVIGAIIGALLPSWPGLVSDSLNLRRQRYTHGLFGTRRNAKDTFEWDRTMVLLTILGFGAVTVPLGAFIGLGLCLLVH